jgi:hypothetical protein
MGRDGDGLCGNVEGTRTQTTDLAGTGTAMNLAGR